VGKRQATGARRDQNGDGSRARWLAPGTLDAAWHSPRRFFHATSARDGFDAFLASVAFATESGPAVVLTHSNAWYVPTLVGNLLHSVRLHDPRHRVGVVCVDDEGFEAAIAREFVAHRLELEELDDVPRTGTIFETEGYRLLASAKLFLCELALRAGYRVLYLDPDQALLAPCIDDLFGWDADVVVQVRLDGHNCHGVIKLECTEDAAGYVHVPVDTPVRERLNDEDVTFASWQRLSATGRAAGLPFEQFPTGDSLERLRDQARLAHFNYCIGLDAKIALARRCGCWHLD
jgi:hypothetical protein